jgi:holo-[acyl-carrier protein] synthase
MISGIGTDIVEIGRIRGMLEKHPESFIGRVFTETEQNEANGKKSAVEYYAGRWAVKEAVSKALGCGIGENCAWKEIEVTNDEKGKPHAALSGKAKETADSKDVKSVHVSISHEEHYACAFAVLEI